MIFLILITSPSLSFFFFYDSDLWLFSVNTTFSAWFTDAEFILLGMKVLFKLTTNISLYVWIDSCALCINVCRYTHLFLLWESCFVMLWLVSLRQSLSLNLKLTDWLDHLSSSNNLLSWIPPTSDAGATGVCDHTELLHVAIIWTQILVRNPSYLLSHLHSL